MPRPWLSVLIPTYNGEKYLENCLSSIASQECSDIECIVFDDGSTDNTLNILKLFSDKLPLEIIEGNHGGNWVSNTNNLIKNASGEYICFLHQDDMWLDDRLKEIRKLTINYKEIGFFVSPSIYINQYGGHLGKLKCPLPQIRHTCSSDVFVERLLVQNFITIPAPVIKRDLALEVKGLDEDLTYTADWDFWLKLTKLTDIVYTPRSLVAFRVHPDSQTVVLCKNQKYFRKQMETVAERHLNYKRLPESKKQLLRKVSLFSIRMNVILSSIACGRYAGVFGTIASFLLLGPVGWHKFFRDSRIVERSFARYKAKLKNFDS